MKSTLPLLTLAITLAVSCKEKDKPNPNPPEPPVVNETVRTRIRLSGEILSSESPLPNGRKVDHTPQYAKALRDSTLYGVMVKTGPNFLTTISRGLFNNTDSIVIDLPVEGQFRIIAYAYRRGTGSGLFYEWRANEQYFNWPIYTTLRNRMDTSGPIVEHFNTILDTLSGFDLFDPLDSTRTSPRQEHAEADVYRGAVDVTATGAPGIINLHMKRMAFGIRFSAANFSGGKLHAEFPAGYMAGQSVTPANINDKYFIYSAGDFKYGDTLYSAMNVKMSWEKPDGSIVPLGSKDIMFKRNVLTTIHVTISDTGKKDLNPIITETEWSGTETVSF